MRNYRHVFVRDIIDSFGIYHLKSGIAELGKPEYDKAISNGITRSMGVRVRMELFPE